MASALMAAVEVFEAAEANLVKLERLWDEVLALIPPGINFCDSPEYEDRCRMLNDVLEAIPKIDGWKPQVYAVSLLEVDTSSLIKSPRAA